MTTTILSIKDVQKIVQHVGLDGLMDEMIDRLTEAIVAFDTQATHVRTRDGFHYANPDMGLLEWMPVLHLSGRITIKTVGYHPTNPDKRNLPTILGTISSFDTQSGHLIGIADGTFVTALRTGAASAVASAVLASPEASVLGLIGCGAQAVTQLHALARRFPIQKVLIHDADPAAEQDFAARVAALHIPAEIEIAPLARLIPSADILCTATSVGIGGGPVFEDIQTKPGLHINAAGSDFPGKVELPVSLLRRSFVCPDVREQCLREGECQQLAPEEIGADLAEVVKHPAQYEHLRHQSTVFDSTGWALEDHVAMELLLSHANHLGLGTEIQIESYSADVKDPYQFLSQSSVIDHQSSVNGLG